MSGAQPVSEAEYTRIVLSDRDHRWELVEGRLREKPGTTWEHGNVRTNLGCLLMNQLDRAGHVVFFSARVRSSASTILVPDLMAVPVTYGRELRGRPDLLAILDNPLPLVAEIWTCIDDYDVDAKIPVYMQRGDLEIWRIHPYERTVTAWVRQPDGRYDETLYREGTITLSALPDVRIDLTELFDV